MDCAPLYRPSFAGYVSLGLTQLTKGSTMQQVLPDEAMLFFYKHIIMPWETDLKSKKGCWDIGRTREALKLIDVKLLSVVSGQVEDSVKKQQASKQNNFIVFVRKKSQMKDLFKYFRNCAAHGSIVTTITQRGMTLYKFSGTEQRNKALVVSGQLDLECFKKVIEALVTHTKTKPLLHPSSTLRASP